MTLTPSEAFHGDINVLAARALKLEYEDDLARHNLTASQLEFCDTPVASVQRLTARDGKMVSLAFTADSRNGRFCSRERCIY